MLTRAEMLEEVRKALENVAGADVMHDIYGHLDPSKLTDEQLEELIRLRDAT